MDRWFQWFHNPTRDRPIDFKTVASIHLERGFLFWVFFFHQTVQRLDRYYLNKDRRSSRNDGSCWCSRTSNQAIPLERGRRSLEHHRSAIFLFKKSSFFNKKKTRKEAVGLEIPGKQREKKNSATSNGKFPAVEFNLLLIFQDLLSICVSSCDRWSPTADRPIHQPGPSVRC